MTAHTHSPRRATKSLRGVFSLLLALAVTAPLRAAELRLTTENDLFGTHTKDDLYTFAIGIEVDRAPYTLALRENAFTDRAAHMRFDETHLTVGRALPLPAKWDARGEAGLVRVGNGLFGQSTQNTVHGWIGDDGLDLRYVETSLHPALTVTLEQRRAYGGPVAVAPRIEAETIPGLRSHVMVGAVARWRPRPALAFEALVGDRFTHASDPLLARHLVAHAPVVRFGVLVAERVALSWTYNDYGDEREHLSIAYRVGAHFGRLRSPR